MEDSFLTRFYSKEKSIVMFNESMKIDNETSIYYDNYNELNLGKKIVNDSSIKNFKFKSFKILKDFNPKINNINTYQNNYFINNENKLIDNYIIDLNNIGKKKIHNNNNLTGKSEFKNELIYIKKIKKENKNKDSLPFNKNNSLNNYTPNKSYNNNFSNILSIDSRRNIRNNCLSSEKDFL